MKDLLNKVHNCDCLELLRKMPDKSVDLLLIDPPYLVRAGKGGGCFGSRNYLINIGGFTDMGFDYSILDKYKNWICFCSRKQLVDIIPIAQKSDHWNLITWGKTNPVPTCNNKYLPDSEYIIHAWQSGRLFGDYKDKSSFYISSTAKKETTHPNEKPIPLLMKLIRLGSMPGETVVDPFCGSGSTAIACMRLGRNFVLGDRDKQQVEIAHRRIKAAQQQINMFHTITSSPHATNTQPCAEHESGDAGSDHQ